MYISQKRNDKQVHQLRALSGIKRNINFAILFFLVPRSEICRLKFREKKQANETKIGKLKTKTINILKA